MSTSGEMTKVINWWIKMNRFIALFRSADAIDRKVKFEDMIAEARMPEKKKKKKGKGITKMNGCCCREMGPMRMESFSAIAKINKL